jgi:hypothetical protein
MKKTLKLTMLSAVLLMMTGGFTSCEKEYPKEISFTEYSLEGTSCQWINLHFNSYYGDLIIINSNEELINYVSCKDYPIVDFSNQTLLLAFGKTPNIIRNLTKQLRQTSTHKYTLDIKIFTTGADAEDDWIVALLINKLEKKENVVLKDTYQKVADF